MESKWRLSPAHHDLLARPAPQGFEAFAAFERKDRVAFTVRVLHRLPDSDRNWGPVAMRVDFVDAIGAMCYNPRSRVTHGGKMAPRWDSRLRKELAERAERFAKANGLTYYRSCGKENPTILFPGEPTTSRHGNFNDRSYAAILANKSWADRLKKLHSQRCHALPEDRREGARELDSSNSSDALLMNCFCYPEAAERILRDCLCMTPSGSVEFGVGGNVPQRNGKPDRTELDMRIGNIVCEAKLTEPNFTSQCAQVVETYRDLHDVFDPSLLSPVEGRYENYQLIRNVLAAAAHAYHFVLLCDGRRPDLLHRWWTVHAAIRDPDIRARTHFLLWQEVAEACPAPLQKFLREKYGI